MSPILGVIASQDDASAPGGPVTDDPFAVADFINDIYLDNGSTVTVGDLIDVTTSTILTGSGLHLVSGQEAVAMLNGLRDGFLTFDFTVLFEIDIPTPATQCLFHVGTYYAESPFNYINDVFAEFGHDVQDQNTDVGVGGGPGGGAGSPMLRYAADFTSPTYTSGIHKIAVTRTNDRVAICCDGNQVEMDNTQGPFSMNIGIPEFTLLGGFGENGTPTMSPPPTVVDTFYVRAITIYPAQADNKLPPLSTL